MGTIVRLDGPGVVSVAEEPDPPLRATEVRLRTLYSGISAGTELTQYRGTNVHLRKAWEPARRLFVAGAPAVTYPAVIGYEEVGVVDEIGAEVTDLAPGQVVWGVWGHRSTAVVDAAAAVQRVLAPDADPLLGIFSHIGSVALNVVLDADIHVGETVAVFGMGVLGQIVAQLARHNGARVVAIDTVPSRLDLAANLGAETTIDARHSEVAERVRDLTSGRGADVVLEVTGNHQALHEAIRTVATNSRVVAAGFYQGDASGVFLGEEFHHNRVQLICSQISTVSPALIPRWDRHRLGTTVISMATTGRLDLRPLISHVIPADNAPRAYELLASSPHETMQVVLDFRSRTAGSRPVPDGDD